MRVKVLTGLCAVLFLVASAEAVLLVRDRWEQRRIVARDPYRAMRQMLAPDPWSHVHDRFPGDFDDDPLFKDSYETPKWEDQGKEMRMVMNIKGHEQGDYSVNVSGEQLTLIGKEKVTKNDQGMTEESHWSNTQSFPLPPDVDPETFRVERTSDQFVVIFKKRTPGLSSS